MMYAQLQLHMPPFAHTEYYLDEPSRRRIVNATAQIMTKGEYINPEGQRVSLVKPLAQHQSTQKMIPAYSHPVTGSGRYTQTVTFMHQHSVIDVARARALRGFRVGILHHANPHETIAGYVAGSHSQSSCIWRSSTLAATPMTVPFADQTGPFYAHTCMSAPDVTFFRTHVGDLVSRPWQAHVVSVVPPQADAINVSQRAELPLVVLRRLEHALHVMAQANVNVVVVGGWGLGRSALPASILHDAYVSLLTSPIGRHFAIMDVVLPGGMNTQPIIAHWRNTFHQCVFSHTE